MVMRSYRERKKLGLTSTRLSANREFLSKSKFIDAVVMKRYVNQARKKKEERIARSEGMQYCVVIV